MAMNNKGRSNNCIFANIMKLSPFSRAPVPPSTKQVLSFTNSVKVTGSPPIQQFQRRGGERKTSSKPASCVIVPIEGTGSGNGNLRVLCEERIDQEAWDFINSMHARNSSVLNEA